MKRILNAIADFVLLIRLARAKALDERDERRAQKAERAPVKPAKKRKRKTTAIPIYTPGGMPTQPPL